MNSFVVQILIAASPSILLAFGALCSEYAGVMAVFLEGIINFSAFLFFTIAHFSSNVALSIFGSIGISLLLIFLVALFIEKTKANPFLVGFALNLLSAGIISLLSSYIFKTRGVISDTFFADSNFFQRETTTIAAWLIAACAVFIIQYTKWGLRLRITGSDAAFLRARGISAAKYRIVSWVLAAFFASSAGCILAIRLQSYVPNMSAGRGWIALAAVLLGRKKPFGVIVAVFVFASAEYIGNFAQGAYGIPPSVLLSLPYIVAFLWFLLPQKVK